MSDDSSKLNTTRRRGRRVTRRRFIGTLILAATSTTVGCGAPAHPTPSPAPAALLDPVVGSWQRAAVDEGEVRAYADLGPGELDELDRLFSRRHPEVQVAWTRGLDRELLGRALDRAREGYLDWDVFVGDAGTRLKRAGLAARWSPPEAGALRPEYADPEGAWYALAVTHHVLQYHIEQVPVASRPTRYEDLAAPHFHGRLAAEQEPLTWLSGLVERLGRDAAIERLRPLAAQGVVLRPDPAALSQLVAAGRHAVAISNRLDAVERDRRAGAKIGWVGIEPVIAQPTAVVLAADSPRPNGARLLANFLLTADAQAGLALHGRVPTRRDVDPEPQNLARGLRPHLTLPPEGAAERELRELYAALWPDQ